MGKVFVFNSRQMKLGEGEKRDKKKTGVMS